MLSSIKGFIKSLKCLFYFLGGGKRIVPPDKAINKNINYKSNLVFSVQILKFIQSKPSRAVTACPDTSGNQFVTFVVGNTACLFRLFPALLYGRMSLIVNYRLKIVN